MGLTLSFKLKDIVNPAETIEKLRQEALKLTFDSVSKLYHFYNHNCEYEKWTPELGRDNHGVRWMLCAQEKEIKINQDATGRTFGYIKPIEVIGFITRPGKGCEPAHFGWAKYDNNTAGWRCYCKTQYAAEYGIANFLKVHLSVCSLLEIADTMRLLESVDDDGDYWNTKSIDRLTERSNEYNEVIAGLSGVLEQVKGLISVDEPIRRFKDFEHLEARGVKRISTVKAAQAFSNIVKILEEKKNDKTDN